MRLSACNDCSTGCTIAVERATSAAVAAYDGNDDDEEDNRADNCACNIQPLQPQFVEQTPPQQSSPLSHCSSDEQELQEDELLMHLLLQHFLLDPHS